METGSKCSNLRYVENVENFTIHILDPCSISQEKVPSSLKHVLKGFVGKLQTNKKRYFQ